MKVLMTGGGGLLALAVRPRLAARGDEVRALRHSELDVADAAALSAAARDFRPDWIFHFAAWTRVDDCERDPARAHRVNAEGSRNAALAARDSGSSLLAISSDYVFDGASREPYDEEDPTGPVSVYGASKLAGEEAIRETGVPHLIVRTAWLFGDGGRNFVDVMLQKARGGESLRVADDQRGSPTHTPDLAEGLLRLVERAENGTYHVVNAGEATWHELASAAIGEFGLDPKIERISTASLGLPARRPEYSVLDTSRFTRVTGWTLPHWRDAVARHVRARREAA